MNYQRYLLAGGILMGMVVGGNAADAAPSATPIVTWHTEKALLAGTGCKGGYIVDPTLADAWAIANGNDVSFVFTNLQVTLPGNGTSNALSDRKQCSVRIPVDVIRGFYLADLSQTFTGGFTKSDNVDLSGAASSTFFNLPVQSPMISVPAGVGTALNDAQLSATTVDHFGVAAWCKSWTGPNNYISGNFKSNVAVSAQRATAQDDAIIGADAVDLHWEITQKWFLCP